MNRRRKLGGAYLCDPLVMGAWEQEAAACVLL